MYDNTLKDEKASATMLEDLSSKNLTMNDDLALGEEILEKERDETLWQSAMSHKLILAHSTAAFLAGGVFGYDSVVNGASISMPAFLLYFGAMTPDHQLYIPSIWASLWTAMSYLLQAIGGFGVGFVSDRIGRKWSAVGSCFISFAGVGMQFAANSRGLLLAGKMVNGLAIGCVFATATSWASEISPVRLRGPIQSGIVLFMVLIQGVGLAVIRVYISDIREQSFRTVFAIQWVWPAVTALVFAFMPESPSWLLVKGKESAAKKALARLHGKNNHIDARFALLRKQVDTEKVQSEKKGAGGYLELFQGSNFKRTLTVFWLFLAAGLNGASLLAQNVYFLIIAGLAPVHAFDIGIGGFGLAIVAIVASWFYMEKFGRRSIWLVGCFVNILIMAAIGGLYYSKSHGALWAVAILM